MNFAGKVAVVTGASAGIGAELARQLAAQQAKVALMALPEQILDDTARSIADAGGTVGAFGVDVGDRDGVNKAMGEVSTAFGPIDVLILNAGIGGITTVEQFSAKQFETMVRVNLLGAIYALEAVLPAMLSRRSGRIAGMSSLSSLRGQPVFSGYCATKAALATLLEGLRIELQPYGVSVTTVRPGFVRTPMTAAFDAPRFLMEVEPAARVILKAIAAGKAEVNFPWQWAVISEIVKWLPNRVYDRVATKTIGSLKSPETLRRLQR
jgi:short-subunit dehydrogenase